MRTFLSTHHGNALGKEFHWDAIKIYYTSTIREKIVELTKYGNWVSQWYLLKKTDIGSDAGAEALAFYLGLLLGQQMRPEFKGNFIAFKIRKNMNYYRFKKVIE